MRLYNKLTYSNYMSRAYELFSGGKGLVCGEQMPRARTSEAAQNPNFFNSVFSTNRIVF